MVFGVRGHAGGPRIRAGLRTEAGPRIEAGLRTEAGPRIEAGLRIEAVVGSMASCGPQMPWAGV